MKPAKKRAIKTLDRKRYQGELTVKGKIVPVKFEAWADQACRLFIKLNALSVKAYVDVMSVDSKPGQSVNYFSLRCKSTDGYRLESDHVTLTGFRSGTGGYRVSIHASLADVYFPLVEPFNDPVIRLVLRSFQSFRVADTDTPLGKLTVRGVTRVDDPDSTSGQLWLIAPSEPPEKWFAQAMAFLEHMREGLAFAHGGRLQVPRIDRYEEAIGRSTYYAGQGSQSELPIQYSLHQEPIVTCLVDRYFAKGPLPDHLWDAVGWMQMETRYNEVRFLTGMTALESILEHVLPAKKGTTIPKTKFKDLKAGLIKAVDGFEGLSEKAREVFRNALAGINRKTFAQKIDSLFDHYGISRRDFGQDVVKSMINLRNDVVHRGQFSPGTDSWAYIVLVRELIVRIVLAELGFKGRYCCYIGGLHDRDFPDLSEPPL